jgi:hypothetical protein
LEKPTYKSLRLFYYNEYKEKVMKINTKYIATIGILSAIAAVMVIPGNALAANPNTDNPSGWGKLTSGAAKTDGKAFGEHASSPPAVDLTPDRPGRAGIGNINSILTGNPDSSKHPSELGQSLCTAFSGTFPCP